MILRSYEISNWGPHKYQFIEFPRGAKTIALCAENDEGKSWVVRGIGFTLSIGRNEYGDQTSIHDGEAEATHKLVIEHRNETHTIEKIVRGKNSEEEGTETRINGNKVDRAGYEEFYNKTLSLPHPSIWLPIVISMQNATDFHLRSKKSEREEALRAPCQLDRIDNWKDALQAKTNDEDKRLLAEASTLKGQLESLQKELTAQTNTETELKDVLQGLIATPHGPLEAILQQVAQFEEAGSLQKQSSLEKENLLRETNLQESASSRAQAALAALPGANPEEEEKMVDQQEQFALETQARTKKTISKTLSEATKSLRKKQKEKKELGEPLVPETLQRMETEITSLRTQTLQLRGDQEKLGKLLTEAGIPDQPENIGKEQETCSAAKTKLEQRRRELDRALHTEKELRETIESTLGEALSNPTEAKTKLSEKLQKHTVFGTGPIGEHEGHQLLARLLTHWEDSPHSDCPLCCQSLANVKLLQKPASRQGMLEELLKEQPDHHSDQKIQREIEVALQTLPRWEKAKSELQALLSQTKNEGEAELESLQSAIQQENRKEGKLEQSAELLAALKTKTADLETATKKIEELCPGTRSLEEAEARFKSEDSKQHKIALLNTELAADQKEVDRLADELDRLASTPEPSEEPALTSLTDAELKTRTEELAEKISVSKKNRAARTTKEKEAAETHAKWEAAKKRLDEEAAKLSALETKLAAGCSMPIPDSLANPTWEQVRTFWRGQEKETTKIQTLLGEIPKKKQTLQEDIRKGNDDLEKTNQQVRKAQAARRLVAFLDYKNAPRKLLQNLTEKLFAATNKIGRILQVDIQLLLGKNLEFLTLQSRAGRLIEQKTERLGFGKGAILGICFRLACQKILLPETGFLILDEPTANVDQKRKSALKSFLQNLGEETESKTKQVILIEHDLDVIELCQAKIQIGAGNGIKNP